MDKEQIQEDLALAQKVCQKILSGNREAILDLYQLYHADFINYAKKKLFDPSLTRDVLNNFWMKLLDGKAVCSYQAKNDSSLKHYLWSILFKQVITLNRKIDREKKAPPWPEPSPLPTPGAIQEKKFRAELIDQALFILSRTAITDAQYVQMYLNDMSYLQMALTFLGDQDYLSEDEIEKKTNAIKKQFTRKRGSLDKFRNILERLMKNKGLEYNDLL